jgi:hypothetical protein
MGEMDRSWDSLHKRGQASNLRFGSLSSICLYDALTWSFEGNASEVKAQKVDMKSIRTEDDYGTLSGVQSTSQQATFKLVQPLMVLSFLGTASMGLMAPVIPVLMTEVGS